MNESNFEIGVVYRDSAGHLHLAISPNSFLTFRKRVPLVTTPKNLKVVRAISVDDLTKRWGITLDELDIEMAKHRTLPPGRIKGPISGRAAKEQLMFELKNARMGRLPR